MTQRQLSEQIASRMVDKYVGDEPSMYNIDVICDFFDEIVSDKLQMREFISFMRNRAVWIRNGKNDDVALLETIASADIPNGIKHSLLAAGQKTMGDVIRLPKSIVRKFRNVGKKKMCLLEEWFRKRNLEWK